MTSHFTTPAGPDRILILGNRGFVGRHLEKRFSQITHGSAVIGINRSSCDLTSPADVKRVVHLFNRDTTVILLAALKRQFGDTLATLKHNLSIIMNLCPLFETHPVNQVVYLSSTAVYGEDIHNRNITEETPAQPTSYYGMAKFLSERLLWKSLSQGGTPLLILRPPTLYGPGDRGNTYGPINFLNAALKREPVTLWGDGTELREFVYINDLAEIVHRFIMNSTAGLVNVVTGRSRSFMHVLSLVETVSGRPLKKANRTRTKRKIDHEFSSKGLEKMVGPFKFTPIEKGIEATWRRMKDNAS